MTRLARLALAGAAFGGLLACGSSAKDAADAGPPAAAVCSLRAPAPPDWRLVAHGALLEDGLGRTVFLRGVNAGGRSKFAPYVPFDFASGDYASALESYMSRAESWGIDAMRVPFTWAALEPSSGATSEAWLSMYAELLESAWSHGIYAVVDFHQDVYSEVYCGDGFPGWTVSDPPAPHHDCPGWQLEYLEDTDVENAFDAFWGNTTGVQTKYLAAWDTMIHRFADTPGVLGFEPINEPSSGSASMKPFEEATLTKFYATVAAHMRAQAPRSLVFVDTTAVDGVAVQTSLEDPKVAGVVFAPHYYPLFKESPAGVKTGLETWQGVAASWNVPTFLGEFSAGNTATTGPAYIASVFAAVDAIGFAGATEWEYSVSNELWNSEGNSVVAADGTEYPVVASLIRPYARAVAGTSVEQSWDGSSLTFKLSYAPPSATGGTDVTELRVPSRAYPHGFTVSLGGGCYDASSVKGEILVKPSAGVKKVTLSLLGK
jgi:endoglycosylceramidase